ncbi:hypothetical protein TNCV_2892831 [Trichonephila clavipes]|nr:hypothetical protein TNCV_2892831 [Trichonephila clavipes]
MWPVAEWSRYRVVPGLITSSSLVQLKTCLVRERWTLNLAKAQTSSRWFGGVVRRGDVRAQVTSRLCRPLYLTLVQNYVVCRQMSSRS